MMYGVSNKSIFYYMLFFYENWIGGLNEVCGIIYETYDTSIIVPSRILCIYSSVVLVPMVDLVVILVSVYVVIVCMCCM
jgi:hypothetical protein